MVSLLVVLGLLLIGVVAFSLGRARLAARDRLEEWLDRRRLRGLVLVAIGLLLYLPPGDRYNRGLGILLGIAGLVSLAFERSEVTFDGLIWLRRLVLSFPVAVAVWAIATLPPPALWSRLTYCAVAFLVPLMIFHRTRRAIAADEARFQRWARDMESTLAPPEAGQFGPNGAQVVAFLSSLEYLTPGQWEAVVAREEQGARAVRALEQVGRAQERSRAVGVLSKRFEGDYRRGSVASIAVEALVVRDLLDARDFAGLYAPFEPFIPIARLLGSSQRPPLEGPPLAV